VIKLHGDYADLEQRNTADELAEYPEALAAAPPWKIPSMRTSSVMVGQGRSRSSWRHAGCWRPAFAAAVAVLVCCTDVIVGGLGVVSAEGFRDDRAKHRCGQAPQVRTKGATMRLLSENGACQCRTGAS
jgi:hypothetical protein